MNIGDKHKESITVSDKDTAIAHGSGGLEVYATPAMVALMESAAYRLLKAEDTDSVGIEMNVRHTRACKTGTLVNAEAEITSIDGKRVTFNIIASDDKGEIGSAVHVRYIIDPVRFMERLG